MGIGHAILALPLTGPTSNPNINGLARVSDEHYVATRSNNGQEPSKKNLPSLGSSMA